MYVLATPDQLRAARAFLHLRSSDILAHLGVHSGPLSNLESGKAEPTIKTLKKFQEFYESQGVEFHPDGWVRLK